jgi:hypothetical protein
MGVPVGTSSGLAEGRNVDGLTGWRADRRNRILQFIRPKGLANRGMPSPIRSGSSAWPLASKIGIMADCLKV